MPKRDPRRAPHSSEEPSLWEQEVFDQWMRGSSMAKLAEIHDCSVAHIKKVVDRVRAWLRPQMAARIDEAVAEQVGQHRAIFEECMTAWHESRGQMVKETIRKRADGSETVLERTYSSGQSSHLANALRALQKYRDVIGYEPPAPDSEEDEYRVAGRPFIDVLEDERRRLDEIIARQKVPGQS